ncbi:MAG: metal ABC transporter solute-binding protein, Zn/Mn family, partial [Microcystaceae cyanobacterium]
DRLQVNVMVDQGVDPHTYEPKPEQMKYLGQSQLYFAIGGGLENAWLPRLRGTNPGLTVKDTSLGIKKIPQISHDHDHHQDHEKEDHQKEKSTAIAASETTENNNLDPHIWLSPRLVKQQAQTIYAAIAARDPKNQAIYQANLKSFLADLDKLDGEIRNQLKPVKNHKFMVFHPEWGYFAEDYGLEMLAIEVEGKEPTAAQLAKIIEGAKTNKIKVIFTQPEFSPQTAEVLAKQLGIKVIPISAMSGDWMNNLRQVSQTLAANL